MGRSELLIILPRLPLELCFNAVAVAACTCSCCCGGVDIGFARSFRLTPVTRQGLQWHRLKSALAMVGLFLKGVMARHIQIHALTSESFAQLGTLHRNPRAQAPGASQISTSGKVLSRAFRGEVWAGVHGMLKKMEAESKTSSMEDCISSKWRLTFTYSIHICIHIDNHGYFGSILAQCKILAFPVWES